MKPKNAPAAVATSTTVEPIAVDVRQASIITGIAVSTLNRWRVMGGGPRFVKAGRCVRYRIADLHTWMDERVVSSTAEVAAAAAREGLPFGARRSSPHGQRGQAPRGRS